MLGKALSIGNNEALISARSDDFGPVFIIKCTRKCNLRCTYCTDFRQRDSTVLNVEKLAQLFYAISTSSEITNVHFIWHGGEPLTKGLKFFDKIMFLQDRFLSDKQKVTNTIQTNGTLVNKEWAEALHSYRFSAGVSLDGPEYIQNNSRPFLTQPSKRKVKHDSYKAATEGICYLTKANVPKGILTVVSEEVLSIGARKMYHFYRENGITNFALLWMRADFSSNEKSLNYNHRYGDFLAEILQLWLEEDNPKVTVREVDSKLNKMLGLPSMLCKDSGCCVGKYYGVEPEGSLWHCDKFMNDERFSIGDVLDVNMGRLAWSEKVENLAQIELDVRNQCGPCKWFEHCMGGCLSDLLILLRDGGRVGTNDCWHYRLYEELSKTLAHSPSICAASQGRFA